MNIIAQVFGLLAFLCIIACYQQVKKEKFLIMQFFSNTFYMFQYILLNAYPAAGSSLISIFRSLIVYNYEKKKSKTPITYIILIEFAIIIIGIITYKNIYSLIPIFIALVYTMGMYQKKLYLTYLIGFITAILWLIYNYIVGAYISLFCGIFELLSAFSGLVKVIKNDNKRRNPKRYTKKRR